MNTPFDYKAFLSQAPHEPGVYRMYNADEKIIYVGKAKNLHKRLSSYFRKNVGSIKTETLVRQIAQIDFTVTQTETEALLLEHNYIKQYQPRYNVLLRDDKSYPYIALSHHKHPRLLSYRGTKMANYEYFGPYPSSYAVKEILSLLQKLFPIRQCEDSFYGNRSRPCLQYQIKRCLAPCVAGHVTDEDYQKNVNYTRLFLLGKDHQVIDNLVRDMEIASENLEFEKAAKLRDLIQSVRQIVEKQSIEGSDQDIDVIGSAYAHGMACIYLLFIRHGKVLGHRTYFPKVPADTDITEIMQTFVGQFYLEGNSHRTLPSIIFLDQPLPEKTMLAETLTQIAGRKIRLETQPKGEKAKTLLLATKNADIALQTKLTKSATYSQRFEALKTTFGLPDLQRIECFDISHMMGKQTVASCVVFGPEGPIRAEFRRYNITGITGGDDYAAMEQVLTRRYSKQIDADKIPDIIFIDGGKGQLSRSLAVFEQLNVSWDKHKPRIISIAKGSERKEGLETLFEEPHGEGYYLPAHSPELLLIQQIRNASHDHAILGHRQRKVKVATSSSLELIEGVGPKRRQQLLKYMGGLQPLMQATIEQIAEVPGISRTLAEKIHHALKQ